MQSPYNYNPGSPICLPPASRSPCSSLVWSISVWREFQAVLCESHLQTLKHHRLVLTLHSVLLVMTVWIVCWLLLLFSLACILWWGFISSDAWAGSGTSGELCQSFSCWLKSSAVYVCVNGEAVYTIWVGGVSYGLNSCYTLFFCIWIVLSSVSALKQNATGFSWTVFHSSTTLPSL